LPLAIKLKLEEQGCRPRLHFSEDPKGGKCRRELLPNDLVTQGDHIICGSCGREIYVKTKPTAKLKCPKCGEVGEVGESKTFVLIESCCS